MLVDASHDKVSGTRRPRHIRRFHVPEEGCRTKLYPTTDEKHHTPWKEHGSRIQEKRVFRVGGGARVKASRMNTACSATFGDQMNAMGFTQVPTTGIRRPNYGLWVALCGPALRTPGLV